MALELSALTKKTALIILKHEIVQMSYNYSIVMVVKREGFGCENDRMKGDRKMRAWIKRRGLRIMS
jgi:hypothetical protein